jgi:hypothetical protein
MRDEDFEMNEDDLEDLLDLEKQINQEREEAIRFFIQSCFEAYNEVMEHGLDFLDDEGYEFQEREEVRTALRKALAVLERHEEYEKCRELSLKMEFAFPGFDTTPNREYVRELLED